MKAILRIVIDDWTLGGLPTIKRGSNVLVSREEEGHYIGKLLLRGVKYTFTLNREEFTIIN